MRKRLCLFVVLAAAAVLAAAPAAKAEHVFLAFLTGDQERPRPVPTGAFGYAVFVLSDDATSVRWGMSYGGLEGGNVIGAHFHRGGPEAAGPIVRGYNPADFGSPDGYVVDS